MTERSEEDVVSGVLRITIDGAVRLVPTLKAKYVAEWAARLTAGEPGEKALVDWTVNDTATFGAETVSRMLDLIVAYDRTGALGGREWLEEHADPAELERALEAMVGNAFPFAEASTLTALTISVQAAASVRPSSTNGHSTNGARTRTRSGRALTPSR